MKARERPGGSSADQDRRQQRAENPDRGDDHRFPADREHHAHHPDQAGAGKPRPRRDQVIHLRPDQERRVEAGEGARDSCQGRLGAPLALVEPDSGKQERGGAEEAEDGAHRLVDPAPIDRDSEQEDDSEQDRDAADPGEDAAAEDLLEAAPWGFRVGVAGWRHRSRGRPAGLAAGVCWRRWQWGGGREDPVFHPLEPARQIRQPPFVRLQSAFNSSFGHGYLLLIVC